MTAEMQTGLWGVAVVVPVVLNALTKRDSDALGISVMLLLIWVLGRVFWALSTPPESMQWYPLIDALAGATCFTAWATVPRWWKLVLVALFVGQCTLHAAFWLAWENPLAWPYRENLLLYLVANNTLFALELVCVTVPGGLSVARSISGLVSGRPRGFHHARS